MDFCCGVLLSALSYPDHSNYCSAEIWSVHNIEMEGVDIFQINVTASLASQTSNMN